MEDVGIEPNNEDKFNPKIIYESFYDTLKFSNYKVLKCSNLVFKKEILSNKGSIIVIVYFVIYLIFSLIFIIKGISSLKISCSKFDGLPSMNPNDIKKSEIIVKSINEKNNNAKNFKGKKKVVKIIKKVKKRK